MSCVGHRVAAFYHYAFKNSQQRSEGLTVNNRFAASLVTVLVLRTVISIVTVSIQPVTGIQFSIQTYS